MMQAQEVIAMSFQ